MLTTRPWTKTVDIVDVDNVSDEDLSILAHTPYLCGSSLGDGRLYIDQWTLHSFLEIEEDVDGGSGLSRGLFNALRTHLRGHVDEYHFFATWYGKQRS